MPLGGLPLGVMPLGVADKSNPLIAVKVTRVQTPGAFTATAPFRGTAHIFIWSPGASGQAGGNNCGGSGGTSYERIRVRKGQVVTGTVGTPGAGVASPNDGNASTATTFNLPNGTVMSGGTAQPGTGGGHGTGGTASGGRINRNGSTGGQNGTFGGSAGASTGGAGAPGYTDDLGPSGGDGNPLISGVQTIAPQAPGAGSSGNSAGATYDGAKGEIYILWVRAT